MAVVIKNLLPQPVKVQLGGPDEVDKVLEVRGLTLEEVLTLLGSYSEPLNIFFGAPKLDFVLLASNAPDMVAEVIAVAAGAKGQEEDIKLLPLQNQVDLLMAIWDLSVPNVKKLLASLQKVNVAVVADAFPSTPELWNTSSPRLSTVSSDTAIN